MILGIDIGGTAVKMGLVDSLGKVHAQHEASVCFDGYRTPVLRTVVAETRLFAARHAGTMEGIGVSATGQIDSAVGVVIGSDGKIANYENSEIKRELEAAFGVPAVVLNDANAAAVGECFVGRAAGLLHVVMLTIGTGVGGGIIIDGHIYGGARGLAGEVGHFPLHQGGRSCSCGRQGCFEMYASAAALVRAACLASNEPDMDGRTVFDRAAEGDAQMLQTIDDWLEDIAAGIIGLVHVFNPQMVLIGGGISAQEDLFIRPLRERVLADAMPRFAEGLALESAILGNQAGLIGAARFCMERMGCR